MNPTLIKQALQNLCPRCLEGEIYRDFLSMHRCCLHCQYLFKKGSGYFIGSLVINYTICAILLMPIFLALVIADKSPGIVIGVPLFLLLVLQPFMIRWSRLLWIHIDYRFQTAKH
jgi:uncharacterized protein (DUF983 family)